LDNTDAELLEFLDKGHQHVVDSDVKQPAMNKQASFFDADNAEVLASMRADCLLYEKFKRSDFVKKGLKLNIGATLVRGKDDPFTAQSDMTGWTAEFDKAEEMTLNAGHNVYSDAPGPIATMLLDRCGLK